MKLFSKLSYFQKILTLLIITAIISVVSVFYYTLKKIYLPNVIISNQSEKYLYIPTGSNFDDVCRILYQHHFIINLSSFEWLAEKKNYTGHIKPGKYKLKNRMNNNELIRFLRSGKQEPVKLSLNNIRTLNQLAGTVGHHIEADSASILQILNDPIILNSIGFDRKNILAMIIPNTYEFNWNTNAVGFIKRMSREFHKFWDPERLENSKKTGLTPVQVMILASIIHEETNNSSEYPTIAGVYINRLKREMPLQADPTIKFVAGDFSLKRILHKYIEINSPFNTYLNKGLPPGPISMPSLKAIEGVLHYEKHNYLYFCAKSDSSGNHVFAKTLIQHNQNAKEYQKWLDKRKIFD